MEISGSELGFRLTKCRKCPCGENWSNFSQSVLQSVELQPLCPSYTPLTWLNFFSSISLLTPLGFISMGDIALKVVSVVIRIFQANQNFVISLFSYPWRYTQTRHIGIYIEIWYYHLIKKQISEEKKYFTLNMCLFLYTYMYNVYYMLYIYLICDD